MKGLRNLGLGLAVAAMLVGVCWLQLTSHTEAGQFGGSDSWVGDFILSNDVTIAADADSTEIDLFNADEVAITCVTADEVSTASLAVDVEFSHDGTNWFDPPTVSYSLGSPVYSDAPSWSAITTETTNTWFGKAWGRYIRLEYDIATPTTTSFDVTSIVQAKKD